MAEHDGAPLVLETRDQDDPHDNGTTAVTPPIEEDYWSYRVRLTDRQSVVGFPKFGTIGIGFAREEDWNRNLSYGTDARTIAEHIAGNAGDDTITMERIIAAIELIQRRVRADRGAT